MHPRSLILAALFYAAGAGAVEAQVRVECHSPHNGGCPTPPAPPAPPAAPAPPAPAVLALPALPAPPPPPPALPEIPDEAHAACAAKAKGSKLTLSLGPGETMSGVCERVGGKMVFRLRSYRSND